MRFETRSEICFQLRSQIRSQIRFWIRPGGVAAGLLALACASQVPGLPECPAVAQMQPRPSESCQSDPDSILLQRQLAALLEEDASPIRVRVEFGSQSEIQTICVDRTSARGATAARRRLAERVAKVSLESAFGPPCLANSRLDFNLRGVQYATIRLMAKKCEHEGSAARRVSEARTDRPPAGFHDYAEVSTYFRCLSYKQARLDQVWLFDDLFTGRVAYVFYGTSTSTLRQKAMHKCFPYYEEVPSFPTDNSSRLPAESDREAAIECMRSEGWSFVPPE